MRIGTRVRIVGDGPDRYGRICTYQDCLDERGRRGSENYRTPDCVHVCLDSAREDRFCWGYSKAAVVAAETARIVGNELYLEE
jgi:hypothetical protein